jgi:hypothetical protein
MIRDAKFELASIIRFRCEAIIERHLFRSASELPGHDQSTFRNSRLVNLNFSLCGARQAD